MMDARAATDRGRAREMDGPSRRLSPNFPGEEQEYRRRRAALAGRFSVKFTFLPFPDRLTPI